MFEEKAVLKKVDEAQLCDYDSVINNHNFFNIKFGSDYDKMNVISKYSFEKIKNYAAIQPKEEYIQFAYYADGDSYSFPIIKKIVLLLNHYADHEKNKTKALFKYDQLLDFINSYAYLKKDSLAKAFLHSIKYRIYDNQCKLYVLLKRYQDEIDLDNHILLKYSKDDKNALTRIVCSYIELSDFENAEKGAQVLKEKFGDGSYLELINVRRKSMVKIKKTIVLEAREENYGGFLLNGLIFASGCALMALLIKYRNKFI